MRVLFVSDNFPPETNAPAVRTHGHAKVWVEQGHDVTVVTCAPNFPTGRVYEGYRNSPYAVEEIDGIRVVRVWTYISANRGRTRRSLDFLSFMVSSIPAGVFQSRPDIVVGTSPQLFSVLAAWIVAGFRGVPSVFELRDLWPESLLAVGAEGRGKIVGLLSGLARFLYAHVTHIVSVTESFVEILAERGVPRDKMSVVRNGVALDAFTPAPREGVIREELGLGPDDMLVSYVGTIGMAHGLSVVLDAAALDPRTHFLIVGEGAEKEALVADASKRGLSNVTFMDRQPRERVPSILAASDAVFVHLRAEPLFEAVIPSKIFEAMAMARPIILAVRGESARIVARTESGLTVEPESPGQLVAAIESLRRDPELAKRLGENGRNAAEREFCRSASALKMLEVLAEVAGRS
jgi:colanic acid biosynthesis glycosyl transferase WcaI